jgi:hypothetical protein
MTDRTVEEEAELIVTTTADELTGVRDDECLYCYVARMVDAHGCDNTLRFARRYRDQRAPQATQLEKRLGELGGYCDCEIFANVVALARSFRIRDEETGYSEEPEKLPTCRGVLLGSTRSCEVWEAAGSW